MYRHSKHNECYSFTQQASDEMRLIVKQSMTTIFIEISKTCDKRNHFSMTPMHLARDDCVVSVKRMKIYCSHENKKKKKGVKWRLRLMR